MHKVFVFDLGGTLMEYKGMPSDWSEYYYNGFEKVKDVNGLELSEINLQKSVDILKCYNPRISGREAEIAPEVIFSDAIANWSCKPCIEKVIDDFFAGLSLDANIFKDFLESFSS